MCSSYFDNSYQVKIGNEWVLVPSLKADEVEHISSALDEMLRQAHGTECPDSESLGSPTVRTPPYTITQSTESQNY